MLKKSIFFIILIYNFKIFAIYNSSKTALYGNAEPVKKGYIYIGIFSPLQYGIKDKLTLISHPILNLLLTPNFFLKLNLISLKKFSDSIIGGYIQSFIQNPDNEYPGFGAIGNIFSFFPSKKLSLSIQTSYIFSVDTFHEKLSTNAYLNFFLTQKNIFFLMAGITYNFTIDDLSLPYGEILYIRKFSSFIISGGVFVGKPFVVDFPYLSEKIDLLVYPVFDVIWEF